MFFIFGISSKEKDLDFSQTFVCPSCGAYGRLNAFMTYNYFSLFFIPLIKWNKKYYLRSSCCGSLYTVEESIGRDIERGRISKIDEADLIVLKHNYKRASYCQNCNYPMERDFDYCPKCGRKI